CPMQGSLSQQMHNLVGLVTYLAGGAGIFLMASGSALSMFAKASLILGGIVWSLSFVLMPEPILEDWRGLLQRVAESVLWLVVLFIAFGLTDAESATKDPADSHSALEHR